MGCKLQTLFIRTVLFEEAYDARSPSLIFLLSEGVSALNSHSSTSGIYTFKDGERLETGESISPAFLEESRFASIVFSKNYASSRWCSDELVKVMECSNEFEIQDLKDCISIEQEEKNESNKKLQCIERELLISKTKVVEQQRDTSTSRSIQILKQKIMKLRKDNELLERRYLLVPKEEWQSPKEC
ncbi:hypothetical protein LguiB_020643 [Lonicera macranthoides]